MQAQGLSHHLMRRALSQEEGERGENVYVYSYLHVWYVTGGTLQLLTRTLGSKFHSGFAPETLEGYIFVFFQGVGFLQKKYQDQKPKKTGPSPTLVLQISKLCGPPVRDSWVPSDYSGVASRLVQWLGWIFEDKERKKERNFTITFMCDT